MPLKNAPLANTEFTFTNKTFSNKTPTVANMPAAAGSWTTVQIDVDRTAGSKSLNSLTSATVVEIDFEYSTDGVTWVLAQADFLNGGVYQIPARLGGGTQVTDTIGFSQLDGNGDPVGFPVGADWRLVVTVTGPSNVTASGTISWQ